MAQMHTYTNSKSATAKKAKAKDITTTNATGEAKSEKMPYGFWQSDEGRALLTTFLKEQ